MLREIAQSFVYYASILFVIYLVVYATYSFLSTTVGAFILRYRDKMRKLSNEMHYVYVPISIILPAYNESVTILKSIESLLELDYHMYEIVVVDDGSKDDTAMHIINEYNMIRYDRPVRIQIKCQPVIEIYEAQLGHVKLTLIRKENGGKADALNMGINACRFPYFICMDADSHLQRDSLKKLIEPVLGDDKTVSVGGVVLLSQCVEFTNGMATSFNLPKNWLVSMQAVEYDRSFLGSRILMDMFNGNLIVSGAFGLFKKSIVINAGGYEAGSLGEDMEIVMRMHIYCQSNNIPYRMRYIPTAVCFTQAPTTVKDISTQRRRWHLGLFQSLITHRRVFLNYRFGPIGFISYAYYLFYELLSPYIELLGTAVIITAFYFGLLNFNFMVVFFALYAIYGSVLSLTIFTQHIYMQDFKLSTKDLMKAMLLCVLELVVFRWLLVYIRFMSLFGYKRKKHTWGEITRVKTE
ncbi:MAG: glycosyltransferase [Defluviitaleaceae bacterium]|nr:glycosyltransferase [Defluviitaleaceae bacterium]